jgi:predicted XRE-type DNA-binding protein
MPYRGRKAEFVNIQDRFTPFGTCRGTIMVHKTVPTGETMAEIPADLRLRRELIAKIASALEARMQRQELTLREAAEMLGVSHPRIADLLAGRAERFSLDRLALLAEQLGLSVRIRATRPYGTGAGGSSD